nr:hypothetical protein [uncultured Albidiferax sp.]
MNTLPLSITPGQAATPERDALRDQFERAYATEWARSRNGTETVDELAAEVKGWRDGDTYGNDLPRLCFGWEGFQWAVQTGPGFSEAQLDALAELLADSGGRYATAAQAREAIEKTLMDCTNSSADRGSHEFSHWEVRPRAGSTHGPSTAMAVDRAGRDMPMYQSQLVAGTETSAPGGLLARQYFYKQNDCSAYSSKDAECICWHDEGTGPLAESPDEIRSWRTVTQPAEVQRVGLAGRTADWTDSVARLSQSDVAGIASDIHQQVSAPAAGAHKETPLCVDLGSDSSKHDFKAAAFALPHGSAPFAASIVPAAGEPVNCMGVPTSCGKPLCSPGDHHPLCRLARQPVPAAQLLAEKATAKASTEIQP